MTVLDSVVDRCLPPAPEAEDRSATRAAVLDPDSLRSAAIDAGFASARVEVIDETVHWESAQQLVALCSSWWACASRLDEVEEQRREAFMDDAVATISEQYPGAFETTGRNHILFAIAS